MFILPDLLYPEATGRRENYVRQRSHHSIAGSGASAASAETRILKDSASVLAIAMVVPVALQTHRSHFSISRNRPFSYSWSCGPPPQLAGWYGAHAAGTLWKERRRKSIRPPVRMIRSRQPTGSFEIQKILPGWKRRSRRRLRTPRQLRVASFIREPHSARTVLSPWDCSFFSVCSTFCRCPGTRTGFYLKGAPAIQLERHSEESSWRKRWNC